MKKPQFTLDSIFQDNMIFQAGKPIRIYGECKKNIDINIEFLDQAFKIRTKSEQFSIELQPESYVEKGFSFRVYTKKLEQVFYNCLIGEVYLLAGDINAYLPLEDSFHEADYDNSNIRLLNLTDRVKDHENEWQVCGRTDISKFSALAYSFAKELYLKTRRPLGIISCGCENSTIFSWVSNREINSHIELSRFIHEYDRPEHPLNQHVCFDNAISKVIPLSLGGVIFYQGEYDYHFTDIYSLLLQRLITAYRLFFKDMELPFVFTQIAGYNHQELRNYELAKIRNAQTNLISDKKKIYLASAMDLGEEDSVCLKDKTIISKRLANVVADKILKAGKSSISPAFYSYKALGEHVIIYTQNNYLNLVSKSNNNLSFTYTTDHVNFNDLRDVRLTGNQIIVKIEKGTKEICYAYHNCPVCDIYTTNDLPLLPFKISLV